MKRLPKTQPGFTFVELMFAIVVLGTMLSLTMTIFVGMLRFYTFSNQIRQNQENGRNILDTMDREIRFSQLVYASTKPDDAYKLCIYNESQRSAIAYYKDTNTTSSTNLKKSVWSAPDLKKAQDGCAGLPVTIPEGKPPTILNLPNMKVDAFEVIKTQGAALTENTNVNALKIRFSFVTGSYIIIPHSSTAPRGELKCEAKNIYCNKLEYNTAVNLRQ